MEDLLSQSNMQALVELGATWGVRIVGVLLALFVAWVIAAWIKRKLVGALSRRGLDHTVVLFFANVARYAILIGAGLGCLGVFGIQTASFAAVLAAGGLAVGLAFQGTLSNFAAGVMLLVFRPFRVGDVVVMAGFTGTIQEIELFTTELTALDNRRIIIPNGQIFGSPIENLTHHPVRRVDIPVGTTYGSDVDEVRRVLEEAVSSYPGVLADPPPQIFLKELADSSVNWQVRVWCNTPDYWDVHQATVRGVKKTLDDKGIGIPFPQRELHLAPQAAAAVTGRRAS